MKKNYHHIKVKEIMARLGINNKIYPLYGKQAFLTEKDHKNDFLERPSFRLINHTNAELGIISQKSLQNVCNLLRVTILANQ